MKKTENEETLRETKEKRTEREEEKRARPQNMPNTPRNGYR